MAPDRLAPHERGETARDGREEEPATVALRLRFGNVLFFGRGVVTVHVGIAVQMTASARFTLIATILGSSIVFIDATAVNVALPPIQHDLGGGLAAQQWIVDAYLLTLGSLILVGGALGDIFGPVRIFRLGVTGFGIASLLCALAPTANVLIVCRGLQGVAGALLTPASLA